MTMRRDESGQMKQAKAVLALLEAAELGRDMLAAHGLDEMDGEPTTAHSKLVKAIGTVRKRFGLD